MDQLLPEEIITIILNLSQLDDKDEIIQRFVEYFNRRFTSVSLKFVPEVRSTEADNGIAIATPRHRFGRFVFEGGLDRLSPSSKSLLEDSSKLLALLLENCCRSQSSQDGREQMTHKESQCSAELIDTNTRLNTILQTIPDPVAVYDQNGRCNYLNPAFEELFGWNIEELINPLERFIPKEQIEQTQQIYRSLFKLKTPFKFENQRITKDGKIIDVYISSAAIISPDEKQTGMVVVYTDITEKKRLMEYMRQTQKMEALGTLASGIAMDINDILGIIVGNTELAIDDLSPTSPVQDYLDEIKTASLRARDVIEQLLSIDYKTDHSKLLLNIDWAVRKFLKILRPTIPAAIDIKTDIAPHLEPILADPTQINELMKNLCTNACEAMKKSGGELQVAVGQERLDQSSPDDDQFPFSNYLKIAVTDNGYGIDPAIKSRIFDPYFTTKSLKKGTGMGLTVVHGIVKAHGGTIDIQSTPGHGTTVTVLFPLIDQAPVQEGDPPPQSATGEERILFIDDEVAILKLARKIITRLGYQVETESNPVKALEMIQKKPKHFDIVIVAKNMFRMNGRQFVKRLVSIAPDIPTIISSAEKAVENQGTRYIKKPLDRGQLAQVIRSALDDN